MKHLTDIFEGLLDADFDVEIHNAMVNFVKFKDLIDIKKPIDGIQPFTGKKCKYYEDDTIMENWANVGRYIGSKNEIGKSRVDQSHNDGNCLIGISAYSKSASTVTIVYNGNILQWFRMYGVNKENDECLPIVTCTHNDKIWSPAVRERQKIYSVAGFYFDKIKEIVGL